MKYPEPGTGQVASYELATLLQLGRRARDAEQLASLGFVVVNETLQLVHYRQAALWLGNSGPGAIYAVSGVAQPETQAPYIQWLKELSRWCVQRNEQAKETVLAPMPLTTNDVPQHIAEEWGNWLPEFLLWLPLTVHQHSEGGLLLARDTAWQTHEYALLSELSHMYGYALSMYAPRHQWVNRLREGLKLSGHGWKMILMLIGIATIPVRLSVVAPAEVAPKEPVMVRAPLEGVIDRFYVQPNQLVKAGTLLFDLEPTAIQSRYDLAKKSYDTAQEEYRQSAQLAVTDDKGRLDMVINKGRLNEKAVELNYSAEQVGRLQIKAARDGIAVFTDANHWQGKAVSIGEKILLLADPDHVELEVHLPAADSIDLEPAAAITLYPNANPTVSYQAKMESMAYHAELMPDGILAYRIKASLLPHEGTLRIGQMGTATVHGQRVPFIYYLLRRPLSAVRQWLGW